MTPTNKASFEEELNREINKSEYRRTYLSIGVILAGLLLASINFIFYRDETYAVLGESRIYPVIFIWLFVFTVYEIAILIRIKSYLKKSKPVPKVFKVINILDEITFMSFLLFILIYYGNNDFFLESPVYVLYFIFIILSALHLDYRLSVLMSIVASIQYLGVTYYAYEIAEVETTRLGGVSSNLYFSKTVLFLLAGVCAGFVAEEINNRIKKAFDNLMAKNKIEKLFGQQVSKEVVNALINQPEQSKKVDASIMFLDIRNFTAMVESKTPQEIIEYQNRIFEPIIAIVNEHQGIVNQILGDGIMATFGTPIERTDHALKAYHCGLKILDNLDNMCQKQQIPNTKIGIGIHTGPVVAGNIGNDERKQFSISGSPVIIAARLEQLTKQLSTQFVISGEVLKKLNCESKEIKFLGDYELKGIERKVEVYNVC